MNIFERNQYKILSLLMIIFSFPSFLIFYSFYELGSWIDTNIYLKIIFIINSISLCSLLIIIFKTVNLKKWNYKIILFLFIMYYIIIYIMNFDFNFYYFNGNIIYGGLGIINFLLVLLVSIIPYKIFESSNESTNKLIYCIIASVFTLIYNIIFTLIFMLKYKNYKLKYLISTLYYLQSNSCLIFMIYIDKYFFRGM